MSEREPDWPVTVRLNADMIRLIDAHRRWQSNRRKTKTTRSDIIRMAIAWLPAPSDPHPAAEEVRRARSAVEDMR